MPVAIMGKFTAIGMRTPEKSLPEDAIIINTCGRNDTNGHGDPNSWVWCNPTNRAIIHHYEDITAVSVECLWQGCKIPYQEIGNYPNPETLNGNWRKGKGKRPRGAYAGPGKPLICTPGEARRKIYIPAFKNLVAHWMKNEEVADWIEQCRKSPSLVFLRDHDTGRGLDRNGPMSHAWLFCEFLNTGEWPD